MPNDLFDLALVTLISIPLWSSVELLDHKKGDWKKSCDSLSQYQ